MVLRRLYPTAGYFLQAAVIIARAGFLAWRGRLSYTRLIDGSTCLMRALEHVGVRFEVTGADGFAKERGPFVFVCNHMSAMETQVLPAIVGRARPLTFVTKASLLRYPIFGCVLGAFDPIVVSRTNPRADLNEVLEIGARKLEAGTSVIIFPQARRADGFDPHAFGTLGMRLARKAGVPMVPIALATTAWARGAWIEDIGWIDPALPARFAIGAPIRVGVDADAAHREVCAFIESRLAAWDAGDRH